MKICHVTNVHPPFDGRIFHKMASSAASNGHDVTLVAPHNQNETINGVNIIPIKKSSNRIKRLLDTYKIQSILESVDADIYHFHDPELIPVMRRFHEKCGKKVIYDIHEYYKEVILAKTWIPGFLRKMVSNIAWRNEINACKEFNCTIAATEELSKVYEPYSNRNEFILNFDFKRGIDFTRNEEVKDIDIVHVGTLSPQRMDFILKIVEELNRRGRFYNFFFIGVPNELSQSMLTRFSKEQLRYIKVVEKVPFEDVRDFYMRAKIGINYHPLEKRFLVAIPMKIFEYMKYGLAVVTSDLPPMRKFISNGVNGAIVIDNTVDGFANAIEKVMVENKFKEIGEVNKRLIYEKYNWESESKRLLEIYETL